MGQRMARALIDYDVLRGWLRGDFRKSGKSSLPSDVKIVAVFDSEIREVFQVYLESVSFEETPDGHDVPTIDVAITEAPSHDV